ncbi:MAG: hypothetical protein HY301_20315 [Verrucomicrobia bacterium]|nr:hypothetical protein [Verrucomicrobiota bacterium]
MNRQPAAKSNHSLALFFFLALLAAAPLASGQGTLGTVNFNNRVPNADPTNAVFAPVYDLIVGGTLLAGTDYLAQLYAGPGGSTDDKLQPVGGAVSFRSDIAGFVNVGVNGSRSIPGVAPGDPVVVEIRAWTAATGASYEAALGSSDPASRAGKSLPLTIQTSPSLLSLPVNMVGLQSFAVTAVPEPDVVWFGTLGLILLILKLRYNKEEDKTGNARVNSKFETQSSRLIL